MLDQLRKKLDDKGEKMILVGVSLYRWLQVICCSEQKNHGHSIHFQRNQVVVVTCARLLKSCSWL